MKKPDSPCVDVCRMNARTRLCDGCGRTIDEISAWSRLDPARRRAIMESLPARVRAASGSETTRRGVLPGEPGTEWIEEQQGRRGGCSEDGAHGRKRR